MSKADVKFPSAPDTSAIDVQDEGSVIVSNPTALNFTGPGVTVTENPSGTAEVDIPGLQYWDESQNANASTWQPKTTSVNLQANLKGKGNGGTALGNGNASGNFATAFHQGAGVSNESFAYKGTASGTGAIAMQGTASAAGSRAIGGGVASAFRSMTLGVYGYTTNDSERAEGIYQGSGNVPNPDGAYQHTRKWRWLRGEFTGAVAGNYSAMDNLVGLGFSFYLDDKIISGFLVVNAIVENPGISGTLVSGDYLSITYSVSIIISGGAITVANINAIQTDNSANMATSTITFSTTSKILTPIFTAPLTANETIIRGSAFLSTTEMVF